MGKSKIRGKDKNKRIRVEVKEAWFDTESFSTKFKFDPTSSLTKHAQVANFIDKHGEMREYAVAVGFESNDKIKNDDNEKVRCIRNIFNKGMDFFYMQNIETFIKLISDLPYNYKIYANNSAKWDARFFMPRLESCGFNQMPLQDDKEKIEALGEEYQYDPGRLEKILKFYPFKPKENSKLTVTKYLEKAYFKPLPYEYKAQIEKGKKIYNLKLYFPNQNKASSSVKLRWVEIRDSLLQFPASVGKMGKLLAAYFNDPWWSKGVMSYERLKPFKDLDEMEHDQDGNFMEYFKMDVLILYYFRKMMKENILAQGVDKSVLKENTQAAMAMTAWKMDFGEKLLKNAIATGIVKVHTQVHAGREDAKNKGTVYFMRGMKAQTGKTKGVSKRTIIDMLIDKLAPKEWMNDINVFKKLKKGWYAGGLTMVNEDYRALQLMKIMIYDIVSSYPTIMASDELIPIGAPVSEAEGQFHLYELMILKDIDNVDGLPFVRKWKMKSKMEDEFEGIMTAQYLKHLKAGMTIRLSTPEYERFLKYYNGIEGEHFTQKAVFSFKTVKMRDVFGSHVLRWFKMKDEAKEDGNVWLKEFAKIMLNALYGKFGTNREHRAYEFLKDETGEFVYANKDDPESTYFFYIPWAIAITAYARMRLVDGVANQYDKFIYCDTDSIMVKDNFKISHLKVGKKLGEWEPDMDKKCIHVYKFLARRAKQYKGECIKCDKIKIAYAGLKTEVIDPITNQPYYEAISFDDLIYGRQIARQQGIYTAPNGLPTIFENDKDIKPVWDYDPLDEQWNYKKEHMIKNYLESKIKHPN